MPRQAPAGWLVSVMPWCAQGRVNPTGFVSPTAALGVPKAEIRIGKPVAYASIIMLGPMTSPTCPGEAGERASFRGSIETTGGAFNLEGALPSAPTLEPHAEVAELADAPDSKSGGAHAPCGFDSHLRHS